MKSHSYYSDNTSCFEETGFSVKGDMEGTQGIGLRSICSNKLSSLLLMSWDDFIVKFFDILNGLP